MIFKRSILTLVALAAAAASVWFYMESGPKSLGIQDVTEVVPDRANAALRVSNLGAFQQQVNAQSAYLDLHPALSWLTEFNVANDSSWFASSEAMIMELADTTWMVISLPSAWNSKEQEGWLVKNLGCNPTGKGRFSLPSQRFGTVANDFFYITDQANAVPPQAKEDQFYRQQFLRSGTCDLSEIRHLSGTAIPLLGTQRSSYVIRDYQLSNQFLLCEEIVEDAVASLKFGPLPADWKKVLPVDLTSFEAVGADIGFDLINEYRKDLEERDELAAYNSLLAELENASGASAEQRFEDWWSGGLARFKSSNRSFLLLGCVDASLARNALSGLPGAERSELAGGTMITLENTELIDHLFQGYLNQQFGAIWVTDQQVVLAEDASALLKLASKVRTGQTIDDEHLVAKALSRNERFIRYAQIEEAATDLLSGTIIPVFPNTKKDPTHYLHSGAPSLDDRLVTRIEVSAAAKPISDIELEWEAQIAGIRPLTIHSVRNHQNNQYYMVAQDENNRVHAIDARGKTMWTYDCQAPIIGDFHTIDLYKNGRVQVMFATSKGLHCLDRRGRTVDGFPVRPNGTISAPLHIADYDNNKNYRFLLGMADGRLLNYKEEGKETNGWKHKKSQGAVVYAQHIKAGNKDYIFVTHEGGKVELLKRNGRSRYDTRLKLPAFDGVPAFRMTSSIKTSTVLIKDKQGSILEASFGNGSAPETALINTADAFDLTDLDGDRLQDLLIVSGNTVEAFTSGKQKIFSRTFDEAVLPELRLYSFSDGKKVGAILPESAEIHLLEIDGSTAAGYPLYGAGPFVIRDLDADGSLELISTDGEGLLVCYQL
ncbi:hypothetical protein [Sanyastnella coralliicola]|uniref:hypothetical protein n=1 Tax=Sanyastnella coralliicola TaxID=3069118 RepID=UPI0027B9246E|nr:hypothetical protein [Longitalea sp. SCSIO 12813]